MGKLRNGEKILILESRYFDAEYIVELKREPADGEGET